MIDARHAARCPGEAAKDLEVEGYARSWSPDLTPSVSPPRRSGNGTRHVRARSTPDRAARRGRARSSTSSSEEAAEEERDRMAERDAEGVDEPNGDGRPHLAGFGRARAPANVAPSRAVSSVG